MWTLVARIFISKGDRIMFCGANDGEQRLKSVPWKSFPFNFISMQQWLSRWCFWVFHAVEGFIFYLFFPRAVLFWSRNRTFCSTTDWALCDTKFTTRSSYLRFHDWCAATILALGGTGLGGNSSPAAECSTATRTAGVRAQLTAVSCGLRQATLPTCATWCGSEGYCMAR